MNKQLAILFAAANLVICFATGASLIQVGGAHFFSLYFLALVAGVTALSVLNARDAEAGEPFRPVPVLLSLAFLAFYLLRCGSLPVQLDEDMQIGRLLRTADTFASAVQGQQPPVAYFLSRLGMSVFGQGLLGARIFPLLFTALSAPVLYQLLRLLCRSPLFAGLGTVLFLIDPMVQFYACQARPYAFGMFYFLFFLLDCLNGGESRKSKRPPRMLLSGLMMLLSLGLQPVLIVLSAFLFAPLISHRPRAHRLALLGALLLFLPIQAAIIGFHENHLRGLSEVPQSLPGLLFQARSFAVALAELTGERIFLFVAALSCIPLTGVSRPPLRFLAAVAGLFLVSEFLVFAVAIPDPVYPRYQVLLLPILVCLAVCTFAQAEARWPAGPLHFAGRGWVGVAVLVATLLSPLLRPQKNPQWDLRQFYGKLESSGAKGAAFVLSVTRTPRWVPAGFLGLDLYPLDLLKRNVEMPSQWDEEYRRSQKAVLREGIGKVQVGRDVFLYSPYNLTEVRWSKLNYPSDFQPEFFLVGNQAEGFRLPQIAGMSAKRAIRRIFEIAESQEKDPALKQALREWELEL